LRNRLRTGLRIGLRASLRLRNRLRSRLVRQRLLVEEEHLLAGQIVRRHEKEEQLLRSALQHL